MLGQIRIGSDGELRDKVETAIRRLKNFEPPDGYYLAFSGGKDSQCVYHLAKMAGVKFDAHYAVTSVDPPELVQFIKDNYPDVEFTKQHYSDKNPRHYYQDGTPKPITMWSLICDHTVPPTRRMRYCCQGLKEPGGAGRVVVTGVRWAESANRKNTHDVVDLHGKKKKTVQKAIEMGANFKLNKHGELIMNDDNDAERRMVEQCYRTQKTMVNPIVDWEDDDVWAFLNGNGIPHCSLYDEGFERLGCIGCPLQRPGGMAKEFERWPKYKELYIKAFRRMIIQNSGEVKLYRLVKNGDADECVKEEPKLDGDGMDLIDWWLRLVGRGEIVGSAQYVETSVSAESMMDDWLQNEDEKGAPNTIRVSRRENGGWDRIKDLAAKYGASVKSK